MNVWAGPDWLMPSHLYIPSSSLRTGLRTRDPLANTVTLKQANIITVNSKGKGTKFCAAKVITILSNFFPQNVTCGICFVDVPSVGISFITNRGSYKKQDIKLKNFHEFEMKFQEHSRAQKDGGKLICPLIEKQHGHFVIDTGKGTLFYSGTQWMLQNRYHLTNLNMYAYDMIKTMRILKMKIGFKSIQEHQVKFKNV